MQKMQEVQKKKKKKKKTIKFGNIRKEIDI